MWYKTFLPKLHEIINPQNYVEIGIRHGYSLSISPKANKIAIDPAYSKDDMQFEVTNAQFFKLESDKFFSDYKLDSLLSAPFDLAYIDGMHLFEFALRDFINLEKYSGSNSVIILDDVIPRNEDEAGRQPTGGSWTGDVWKVVAAIQEYREDLARNMILARSEPTGCLIITNPSNTNTVLSENYDEIVAKFLSSEYPRMPGGSILGIAKTAEEALQELDEAVNK